MPFQPFKPLQSVRRLFSSERATEPQGRPNGEPSAARTTPGPASTRTAPATAAPVRPRKLQKPRKVTPPVEEPQSRFSVDSEVERKPAKLQKRPPASMRTAPEPWYAASHSASESGSGSGSGSQTLVGTDLGPGDPFTPNVSLTTALGQGFSLQGNRLLEWDKLNGGWKRVELMEVKQLRNGADGHAYALDSDGRTILRLSASGVERKYTLRGTFRDFAVSPRGGLVTMSASGLTWRHAPDAGYRRLSFPAALGNPVSIAFDAEGRLVVMNERGQAWRARVTALAGDEGIAAWRPVEPPPEGIAFGSLASTAHGQVVGIDAAGEHHEITRDGRWEHVTQDAPPSVDAQYGRFAAGPLGTAHFALGFLPPAPERTAKARQAPSWLRALKPSPFQRDHPEQRLRSRWGNWFDSHRPKREPAPGQQLRRELERDWQAIDPEAAVSLQGLRNKSPSVGSELDDLVGSVNDKSLKLVKQLYDERGRYRVAPQARANSGDNALKRLLQQRQNLFPRSSDEGGQVNAQLQQLIDAGVFIPKIGEAPAVEPWRAHLYENHHSALIGKLVSDHAALQGALSQVDAQLPKQIAAMPDEHGRERLELNIQRIAGNAIDHVTGADGNEITRLVNEGVVEVAPRKPRDPGRAMDAQIAADWRTVRSPPVDVRAHLSRGEQTLEAQLAEVRLQAADRLVQGRVNAEVGRLVDHNADTALDRLEVELGLRDANGFVDGAEPPVGMRASSAEVESNANVLYVLYRLRTTLHGGAPDAASYAVTKRLRTLLDRGVYLPVDTRRHVVFEAASAPLEHLPTGAHVVKNKLGVLTGKLVHDHAVLKEAQRLALSEARSGPGLEALCIDEARRVDGGDDNVVSALFEKNFINLDRAKATAKAMQHTGTGIAHEGHKLNRAARLQGAVQGDLGDFYVRKIQSMQPGDSITLKSERTLGLDMDGYGIVTQLSNRGLDGVGPHTAHGIRLNVIPNVQPVPTVSARREHSVTLSRTHDGLQMAFGRVAGVDASLAAKLMWGGGAFLTNGNASEIPVTGVLFAGAEAIPAVSVSVQADNSVALHIPQGDDGEMQKIVRAFFGGTTTPLRLVRDAAGASNGRTATRAVGARLDAHVLATAVGVFGLDHRGLNNAPDNRAKVVFAPFLEQINAGVKLTNAKTRTQTVDGSAESRSRHLEPTLKASHITILEAQHAAEHAIFDVQRPGDLGARIGDGLELQDKYPLYIKVIQKNLWGRPVTTDGLRIAYDENRRPTSVTKVATAVDTPVNTRAAQMGITRRSTRAFDEQHLPELATLLREMPELRPQIEKLADFGLATQAQLEMTPTALGRLHDAMAAAPPPRRHEAMRATLEALAADHANFRITEIRVASTYTYRTGANFGAGPIRSGSRAENTLQTTRGRLVVAYDDDPDSDGPRISARSGGDVLLGERMTPDIEALRSMRVHGEIDRLTDPFATPAALALAELPSRREMAADPQLRAAMQTAQAVHSMTSASAPHVGVTMGHLELRIPRAGGAWQRTKLTPGMRARWLARLDEPHRLETLRAMSEGATGWLSLVGPEAESALNAMAQGFAPSKTGLLDMESPGESRLGRALHVNDILDDLRDGRLGEIKQGDSFFATPLDEGDLDPAQRTILATFFGDPDGEIDREQVARLLRDPVRLATFQLAAAATPSSSRPTLVGGTGSTEGLLPTLQTVPHEDPQPVHISAI